MTHLESIILVLEDFDYPVTATTIAKTINMKFGRTPSANTVSSVLSILIGKKIVKKQGIVGPRGGAGYMLNPLPKYIREWEKKLGVRP